MDPHIPVMYEAGVLWVAGKKATFQQFVNRLESEKYLTSPIFSSFGKVLVGGVAYRRDSLQVLIQPESFLAPIDCSSLRKIAAEQKTITGSLRITCACGAVMIRLLCLSLGLKKAIVRGAFVEYA